MDALNALQLSMERIAKVALSQLKPGDPLEIINEKLKLIEWLGEDAMPLDASLGDRITRALHLFEKNGVIANLKQARLLCYGCSQPLATDQLRLIESQRLFPVLLNYLAQASDRLRPFRKCYLGLLHAYFQYDGTRSGQNIGRQNWLDLRRFLQKNSALLPSGERVPRWVDVLLENKPLLSDDPWQPFLADALRGDTRQFEQVCQHLAITDDSWLVCRFLERKIDAILSADDATFTARISLLLLLINDHPLYIDRVLPRLLTRYLRCADQPDHPLMREFIVHHWGNPWLSTNARQWACGSAERDWVARWQKRHLVREFFRIFCKETPENQRRASFWDLYSADLSGLYFALASDAFSPDNPVHFKFRNQAKGLVVKLTDSKHNLHACIMQFTSTHIVEFNRLIRGAYFYDARQGTPSFYMSKGWMDVGALNVSDVVRQSTREGGGNTAKVMGHDGQPPWEHRFAHELGWSAQAIEHLCQRHGYGYHEEQHAEGALHIVCIPENTRLEPILLGWGYSWSAEMGAYFRLRSHYQATEIVPYPEKT